MSRAALVNFGLVAVSAIALYGVWIFFFTPEGASIGIWQADERLGYAHIPLKTGRHQTDEFDVLYSIDARGCRVTPDPVKAHGTVLVLGDSFTFGHGVNDAETYPALLANTWNSYKVRNCSGMGWGTAQAALVLDDALPEKPSLILYAWIWPDFYRNYLRRSWLETLSRYGRRNAYFDLVDGRAVFKGTAGPENSIADDVPGLADKERNLTYALIRHMTEATASVPFYVAILPYGAENPITDDLVEFLKRERIKFFDLRGHPHPDHARFFPKGGHPTPAWHRAVAKEIAARIPLPEKSGSPKDDLTKTGQPFSEPPPPPPSSHQ